MNDLTQKKLEALIELYARLCLELVNEPGETTAMLETALAQNTLEERINHLIGLVDHIRVALTLYGPELPHETDVFYESWAADIGLYGTKAFGNFTGKFAPDQPRNYGMLPALTESRTGL